MEPFIYRECRATITARIPDTPDADAHPIRVSISVRCVRDAGGDRRPALPINERIHHPSNR